MQRKKEISNELGQLSMMVAGIDRQLPYGLPEGYFEGFPSKMLDRLNQGLAEEAQVPEWGKGPSFDVPTGFFEGFAAKMMDRIKAEEQGEFSPLLDRIGKAMPFQVPEGYFETSMPSALLMGVKDKTVYQVPDGYFGTFPGIMAARVDRPAEETAGPAKVISMNSTRKTTWWKYSAAAVVAGFIFTIGWLRLHAPSQIQGVGTVDIAQGLAKVSDQEIESYLDDHTMQLQEANALANTTASLDISDIDINSLLGDIPDGELKQYMEEHGDLKDYPTN